ncbi:MAG: hypothetical protein HKN62_00330 [Phycisphaerales bacterium]|nr:hypothetical protein [Phycisphaerales bacterium]
MRRQSLPLGRVAVLGLASIGVGPPDVRSIPTVLIDRDNIEITETCRVRAGATPVIDADGNGVVQVTASGITVEFTGPALRGAAADQPPDAFAGVGVRVTGDHVTLRDVAVRGYKVGILIEDANGVLVDGADVSDNFAQRLRSTPAAEDTGDWLWPHANDGGEWRGNYGAGLALVGCHDATIRDVLARRTQNGILLERVTGSRIYDNDCSFLSGWGIALWRSSGNTITRNALDFCIRGYSHGVYNRGQDSAGLLMFEQCTDNVIAENSITHGGDGIFAFSGRAALGEVETRDDPAWYVGRGNRDNLLAANDCSDAAAHGIELTFGFDNRIVGNRLAGNAICGIWGGYSRRTLIVDNVFERNGDAGYGLERGGVNIEHGSENRIEDNRFRVNRCGVHLWWDDDAALAATPWAQANGVACADNLVAGNRSEGDEVFLHLRATGGVTRLADNRISGSGRPIDADAESPVVTLAVRPDRTPPRSYDADGQRRPVGARAHLAGRHRIVMTEWGPYDWSGPLLLPTDRVGTQHAYRWLTPDTGVAPTIAATGPVRLERDDDRITVRPTRPGVTTRYELTLTHQNGVIRHTGVFIPERWEVRVFASPHDPRTNLDAWRRDAGGAMVADLDHLRLRFAHAGPGRFIGAALPADHFGVIADGTLTLPAGSWTLRTTSDDGIRVWLDGETVIDDWTWHPPRKHAYSFTLTAARTVPVRVEHFELDGYAVVEVEVEETR